MFFFQNNVIFADRGVYATNENLEITHNWQSELNKLTPSKKF